MRVSRLTERMWLRLSSRLIAGGLGGMALAAALVQIGLGVKLGVLLLALFGAATGLLGFAWLGAFNLGAWWVLFYVLGNVLIALFAKTLLGQALDSHLDAPYASYLALAVGCLALLFALMLAWLAPVGKPILRASEEPGLLRFMAWGCFGVGLFFWYVNRRFQDPNGSGFGGLSVFGDLLFMAVIARTAFVLVQSQGRKRLDRVLVLFLVTSILAGLINNAKTQVALPVVSYFSTVLFFQRGLPRREVLLIAAGGMLFVSLVGPMIHAYRALGIQQVSLDRKIALIGQGIAAVAEHGEFDYYEHLANEQFQGDNYYGYFGGARGQMILGRYASIQQIAPVVAAVEHQGPVGGFAVWPAFERLAPKIIAPHKPENVESFNILVRLGLISPYGGKFPTLPLVGQAYAAYGMIGLCVIPFLAFLAFALVIKKIGWDLYRNIYAIFFLCDFVVVYANQGDLGQYAGAVLRGFPLFVVTFLILARLHRSLRKRGLGRNYLQRAQG